MEFLIGWMSTIAATSVIRLFTVFSIMKDVANQGFKLNINKMHENVRSIAGNDETGSDKIVDYIPLVNMMNSFNQYTQYIYNRESYLMALDQLDVVEEMNEVEKVDYKRKPTIISILKMYRNEARRKEEERREEEIKYTLQKVHEAHVLEEYSEYFNNSQKAIEEYELDKETRIHGKYEDVKDELEKYRYVEVGDSGRIYYTIDGNKGIYSLDDFRVVYMKDVTDNDDVTFNERKVGYFLSILDKEEKDNNTEKVNVYTKK